MLRLSALVLLLACVSASLGDGPPGGDDWKYDVIHRKRGVALRGLVLEQTGSVVRIRCISRRPRSPTVMFTETIPRSEIDRLVLLTDDERAVLEKRLEKLKSDREWLAARLRALDQRDKPTERDDALDLQSAAWPLDDKVKALAFRSTHFTLVANSRPELVELTAIHLEQVYAAYARLLPPRVPKADPTTILLTRSLAEYQTLAKQRGLNLVNPAFYDPAKNQVVCGSDLERMCDEREKVRQHHEKLRTAMKERKAELAKVYRNRIPPELLAPMNDAEKRILTTEKRNDEAFAAARQRLFCRLYHESFHAYLSTFVYPTQSGELPLWLNEGLAQIFESAIVEVGELRVRPPDTARLHAAQQAVSKGELLPLVDLLKSQPRNFQIAHGDDRQMSDRYYLASWALAYYLTFEMNLLGGKALDEYVQANKRGTDPLEAFRELAGRPLAAFEKDHRAYLSKLRLDGTVAK